MHFIIIFFLTSFVSFNVIAACDEQPKNEVDWSNCNFVEELDLSGASLAGAQMSGVNLSLVNFEKSQINKALAIFKDKKGVFMPTPAAGCKITGHSAEFESDPSSGHAGFHIKWKLSCSNPSKIKNLSTSFFKSFPKAEEIEVEVVSDAGQKEIEWEKDQNKIQLTLSK